MRNNSTIMVLADTATMEEVQLDNTMAAIQATLADTEVAVDIEHLAFDIATAMLLLFEQLLLLLLLLLHLYWLCAHALFIFVI